MTTASRAWPLAGAAVTLGVCLPAMAGDVLVLSHVLSALGRLAALL